MNVFTALLLMLHSVGLINKISCCTDTVFSFLDYLNLKVETRRDAKTLQNHQIYESQFMICGANILKCLFERETLNYWIGVSTRRHLLLFVFFSCVRFSFSLLLQLLVFRAGLASVGVVVPAWSDWWAGRSGPAGAGLSNSSQTTTHRLTSLSSNYHQHPLYFLFYIIVSSTKHNTSEAMMIIMLDIICPVTIILINSFCDSAGRRDGCWSWTNHSFSQCAWCHRGEEFSGPTSNIIFHNNIKQWCPMQWKSSDTLVLSGCLLRPNPIFIWLNH